MAGEEAPLPVDRQWETRHGDHYHRVSLLFSGKDGSGWACNPRPRWSGGSRITGCCRPDWDRAGREPNRQSFRRGIHGLCSRRASHSARSSSDHRVELYGFMCAGNHYGRDRHRWDAAERSALRTCPKDRGPLLWWQDGAHGRRGPCRGESLSRPSALIALKCCSPSAWRPHCFIKTSAIAVGARGGPLICCSPSSLGLKCCSPFLEHDQCSA